MFFVGAPEGAKAAMPHATNVGAGAAADVRGCRRSYMGPRHGGFCHTAPWRFL
jgi:hypothetical protein